MYHLPFLINLLLHLRHVIQTVHVTNEVSSYLPSLHLRLELLLHAMQVPLFIVQVIIIVSKLYHRQSRRYTVHVSVPLRILRQQADDLLTVCCYMQIMLRLLDKLHPMPIKDLPVQQPMPYSLPFTNLRLGNLSKVHPMHEHLPLMPKLHQLHIMLWWAVPLHYPGNERRSMRIKVPQRVLSFH